MSLRTILQPQQTFASLKEHRLQRDIHKLLADAVLAGESIVYSRFMMRLQARHPAGPPEKVVLRLIAIEAGKVGLVLEFDTDDWSAAYRRRSITNRNADRRRVGKSPGAGSRKTLPNEARTQNNPGASGGAG